MNEIFKKSKSQRINLDSVYYLTPDGFCGLVLQKQFEVVKKDKEGKDKLVLKTESFYYPRLSQALGKYLELKTVEASSIEELKEIVLKVEEKINSIKELWN